MSRTVHVHVNVNGCVCEYMYISLFLLFLKPIIHIMQVWCQVREQGEKKRERRERERERGREEREEGGGRGREREREINRGKRGKSGETLTPQVLYSHTNHFLKFLISCTRKSLEAALGSR